MFDGCHIASFSHHKVLKQISKQCIGEVEIIRFISPTQQLNRVIS